MKLLAALALVTALSAPAPSTDLVVTKEKHSDALKMGGHEQPAQDSREVTWIGKDRLRVEEGDKVTLFRADLKKLYLLDTKAKTYSAIDLPLDMKKYMPAEMAPMMEQMMAQVKVTVTPTAETKQIKDWNATRHTLTMTMPMGDSTTQEMWVTQELGVDLAGWLDMQATLMSINPFGAGMAAEMKKIAGFPVLIERTRQMMGSETKSREAVISIEQKEPAAGLYDLPEGYTEKPFDPMEGSMVGGPGAPGGRGSRPRGG